MDAASILFVIFILGIGGTVAIWPGSRQLRRLLSRYVGGPYRR
jgi:hypothetical protein